MCFVVIVLLCPPKIPTYGAPVHWISLLSPPIIKLLSFEAKSLPVPPKTTTLLPANVLVPPDLIEPIELIEPVTSNEPEIIAEPVNGKVGVDGANDAETAFCA